MDVLAVVNLGVSVLTLGGVATLAYHGGRLVERLAQVEKDVAKLEHKVG